MAPIEQRACGPLYAGRVDRLRVVDGMYASPPVRAAKTKEDAVRFADGGAVVMCRHLDGPFVTLHYENGRLLRAASRGEDGIAYDVTHNLWEMDSVPLMIDVHAPLQVHGVLAVRMARCWSGLVDAGENRVSPRQIAQLCVCALDSIVSMKYQAEFVAYGVQSERLSDSAAQELSWLDEEGFRVVEHIELPDGIDKKTLYWLERLNYVRTSLYPAKGLLIRHKTGALDANRDGAILSYGFSGLMAAK